MGKIKILFLYSELMGYNSAWFKGLNEASDVEILVVHWDKNKLTPFQTEEIGNVTYLKRSILTYKELLKTCEAFNPNIVYISGWMDKDYLKIGYQLRKNGSILIGGLDTHWTGSLKQHLGRIPLSIALGKIFDYLFVPGRYQFEYAKKLGFSNDQIIMGLYCANLELFLPIKGKKALKNILYIGRFSEIKRPLWLYDVFNEIKEEYKDWSLTMIGNGPLKPGLKSTHQIEIIDFLQPALLTPYIENASFFCHVSAHEPWGLVIHEMAAAGLPIISTNECGAASLFVKHGYNGKIFDAKSKSDFKAKLIQMMNMSEQELITMGQRSKELSKQITPEIWAYTFLSVLEK